jgi:hypothetical protein
MQFSVGVNAYIYIYMDSTYNSVITILNILMLN